MPDYNWVNDCAQCNMQTAFLSLYELADTDVRKANTVFDLDNTKFSISKGQSGNHDHHEFTVIRLEKGKAVSGVNFQRLEDQIVITITLTENEVIDRKTLTVQWDTNKCACIYKLDSDILDLWQVVQRCLEPVFFKN